MIPSNKPVSLLDMLELHANSFLGAATSLSRLHQIIMSSPQANDEIVVPATIEAAIISIQRFSIEAENIGAKLAVISANRLSEALNAEPCTLTWVMLGSQLNDIESRFADHLGFVKLFAIPDNQSNLFDGADILLGQSTAALFPSIWFDCEEAAKCLCLGRPVACVFHAMRMLETAVGALGKRLGIPDPVKTAERNWGVMLGNISDKMNTLHPKNKRLSGTEGSALEKVYVSLDAIKNPWRNATMHVDTIYTEAEAQHILTCSAILVQQMALIFDENGADAPQEKLIENPEAD